MPIFTKLAAAIWVPLINKDDTEIAVWGGEIENALNTQESNIAAGVVATAQVASDLANISLLDDDTFATANTTQAASSESVKAYADSVASIGIGQVPVDETANRLAGASYQNSGSRPIMIVLRAANGSVAQTVEVSSDDTAWIEVGRTLNGSGLPTSVILPVGWFIRVNQSVGTTVIHSWVEIK